MEEGTPGKWTVMADKPDNSGIIGFGFGTKQEADEKAEELRTYGYKNVQVTEGTNIFDKRRHE